MTEHTYTTPCGTIHYWVNGEAKHKTPQLIFLPGLTADHRLFDKQIAFFEGEYPTLVWDAPGHASSWPFQMTFSLADKAKWLNEILERESFRNPVIIGQSMGGYLGQMFAQLYPEKLKGLFIIDSAPLKKEFYTGLELWLLERMEPVYKHYPWKTLLRQGSEGVAESRYGRKLMYSMMMTYNDDQIRYAKLAGHGYRILAKAVKAEYPYDIKCPVQVVCGEKDHAGSCIRYNKEWHKRIGIPLEWIKDAGHNSNTDQPEIINEMIEKFVKGV